MFREVVLGLGSRPMVAHLVKKYGMALGAARFVAGQNLAEALAVAEDLNRRGIKVTLDHLGEAVTRREEAGQARDSYWEILSAIEKRNIDSTVSLKLTMLGLALDEELARLHLQQIVQKAADTGNFVRIDMEDSRYTEVTLRLFQEMWHRYPGHVGVVLQAYLYRTAHDLQALSVPPKNFRIVKGAYREPVSLAYPAKPDVDANYLKLVQQSLASHNYTAIATHDETIIGHVLTFVQEQHIPRDRFEFQMLYGVKFSLLESLAREGFTTRVYVPFGKEWYAYFLRRIAERPANLLFFIRAVAAGR